MEKSNHQTTSFEGVLPKPICIGPGILIVIVQWLLWFAIPLIFPGPWIRAVGVLGGMLGGIAVMVWWGFFSRAPRNERWSAVLLMVLALVIASQFTHESIKTGMQGMMYFGYAIPILSLAFVVSAVISRRFSQKARRIVLATTVVVASGVWILFRSSGITGDAGMELAWRWSETHEERFLSQSGEDQLLVGTASVIPESEILWSGFRGADRNSIVKGIRIESDWSSSPPAELWHRSIGPGCSSFAVQGNLIFTQEQHGSDEVVACYHLNSGEPVWIHVDDARFWDSHAGAGPRSTPTLVEDRLYTLGATGILNVLNALDGTVIWSRNAAIDAEETPYEWGFTSSPVVFDDVVIVALSGKLAAYNIETGNPIWFGPEGGESYSSPHLFEINGVTQVVMMSANGAASFNPVDGKLLWEQSWPEARIVQPAMCPNGDLLISAGGAKGLRRISVTLESDEWTVEEQWTSNKLRPNFNDFVIHKGHAYGFEGPSLACIELEEGKRKWRGGRYGGQLLLLADQDLLLVLTEKGDLALVEALPERLKELHRLPAIEGKTWNHPVLAGNILLVRNMEEMAAFRLALANK